MGGQPAKEVMMQLYVEVILEIVFIIAFISMCAKDSKQTRTFAFCIYTYYSIAATGLATYQAVQPSDAILRSESKFVE